MDYIQLFEKFGLRLRTGCQARYLGFLHHYLLAGAMGFRLIFQIADQIACDSMRPAVLANVLNDCAQAFLVRIQEVVIDTPFRLPRQGAHGWAFLDRGRRHAATLSTRSSAVIVLELSISKAPKPGRHGLRLTIW